MTPQLRFPEFTDKWHDKRLGGYLIQHLEKSAINNEYPVLTSSRRGIFFQKDYYAGNDIASKDNTGYNVVPRGYFTYRHMSDDLVFQFNINNICDRGIVSTLYPVFTTKNINDYFLKTKLNTGHEFKRYSLLQKQGGSRTYMYFAKLKQLVLHLPDISEQQKIADFLRGVDSKLTSTQTKVAAMHEYKKGVMQALFSGKLRFKDENGNPYPDWEEGRLGDVLEFVKNGLSADQNTKGTGYKVTRIETISKNYIDVDRVGFVDTNIDMSEYKLLPGDMLFSNINSPSQIGRTVYVSDSLDIYHGMNLLRLRVQKEEANAKYIYYVLSSSKYKRYFEKICNKAVNQASINQTDLKKTIITTPSLAEQQKIADFLSALDDKIKLEEAKLASGKEFKKALLQRMFI